MSEANESQSAQLNELAAALAKAQGAMAGARKDATNPHFNRKYADLASVWDACRGPLSANGLAVVQQVSNAAGGVVVTTMLLHSSGQWLKERLMVPVAQNTAQALGSAVTYGRRYSLMAVVGIAPDDDDGNEATANAPKDEGKKTAPRQLAAKTAKPSDDAKRRDDAVNDLWVAYRDAGGKAPDWEPWLSQSLGRRVNTKTLTLEDVAKLQELLSRGPPQVVPEPPAEPKPAPTEDGEITGDVMLSRIATEFGMTLADVLKRAQGVCNGKKSGYSLADAKAVRDSLGAIPKAKP